MNGKADGIGNGWSNGEVANEIFPMTRDGMLQRYGSQRRWLQLAHGWSRIGAGSDEFSHRVSSSSNGAAITVCNHSEAKAVRSLIAQLAEQFYGQGWAIGTSGGVSIRVGGPSENRPWRVFVAPSGIQKEDMIGDDVFEMDMDQNIVVPPKTPNLRLSACTPLWFLVYKHRPSARSVIHTHSVYAQLATLLDPTETSKSLKITHLEMVKGVGNHAYDDILEIPIIDNRPSEDLLADDLEIAMKEYPKCNAVLVRRHGLYVWGDSWEQAKTHCESFEFLFQSAVEMKKLGIDPGVAPTKGTFRADEGAAEPAAKRQKTGFNGVGKIDNAADLLSNEIPILPRDYKHLLLDIEGCTTAISFVKDTLFPYVLEHLQEYLKTLDEAAYKELAEKLRSDLSKEEQEQVMDTNDCAAMVTFMVQNDKKVASLKGMQGKMWRAGYENGQLKGHIYSDFVPMLEWMQSHGVKVHIFSSGSVQAQKLLFRHTTAGDLTKYLESHFDISTSGNKKVATSYTNIAASLGVSPSEIVFCSDSEDELKAAREAGIGSAVMSVRPGNAPIKEVHTKIFTLLQLCGE